MMNEQMREQQARYAELLIKLGVNLQPGQSLRVSGDLEHAEFVRQVVAQAYQAGARYVQVDWVDAPTMHARLANSQPDYLDYFPDYEVARHRQMVDETWARLSLVGPAHPHAFDDLDPAVMQRASRARQTKLDFYMQAVMSNRLQWCVAGVPTRGWASEVYPDLPLDEAVDALWRLVLQTCRVDQPDPIAAWEQHDLRLKNIIRFMHREQIRAVRYLDAATGPDGRPNTDLTVGLTDHPNWIAASSQTPAGVRFMANMPTEEVFSTPHKQRTEGWVRTSKPTFPFQRKVDGAYFRFEEGEMVEYHAQVGEDVLAEFFTNEGARRLGEVSLVDERSPINQAGVIFHEILFDENAVSHIAFGQAYPEGVAGGDDLDPSEYAAVGINESKVHVDFMIGTPTMRVIGIRADGSEVLVMENGRFTADALGG
jgi:aminopeptidase